MFALVAAVFGFPCHQQQRITFQQTLPPQYVEVHTPRHQPIPQIINMYTSYPTEYGRYSSLGLGGIQNPFSYNQEHWSESKTTESNQIKT